MTDGRKTRSDAVDAGLDEEARWALFDTFRRGGPEAALAWLRERGVSASRAAIYRFDARMRPLAQARRLERAALAGREARGLAERAGARKRVADAFLALGTEIALRTEDPAAAAEWIRMSAQLVAAAQKDREIELRAEGQRLDREKFEAAERRLAAVQEAVKTVKSSGNGLSEESLRKIEEAAGLL